LSPLDEPPSPPQLASKTAIVAIVTQFAIVSRFAILSDFNVCIVTSVTAKVGRARLLSSVGDTRRSAVMSTICRSAATPGCV